MTALREVLALFDVEFDASALDAGNKKIESAIGKLQAFGAAIAGSAIVMGLKNMISELEGQASTLDDSATQLGLSAQELQEYRYAAKMAGLENAAFDKSLTVLTLNQGAAAEGGKAQAAAFKAVGITATGAKLSQMTLSELLPQIADGLSKVESTSERARMAQQLFGKQGAKLAPLLGEGAAGMAKFRAEIEELGGGFTADATKSLAEYGDTMDKIDMATTSLKVQLVKTLGPALVQLANKLAFGIGRLSRWVDGMREAAKQSNIAKGIFGALGAAGIGKLFSMAKGWSGIAKGIASASRFLGAFLLRLALPALLIDELITTWEGGDTIIRRILDGWFGEGQTAKIVGFFKVLTGGWENFVFMVDNVALMVGAIIVGMGAEISNVFSAAWASVQDSAGAAWNSILSVVAGAITEIARLMSSVGLDGVAAGLADKGAGLAGLLAKGGNADRVALEHQVKRTERVEVFERAKSAIGDRITEVTAPTTIHVNVPPGTPATMAHRVGQATKQAVAARPSSSPRAKQAALTHRAK